MKLKYTVGSLFAGVGGIDLGFESASYKGDSYEILWANEIDEYAVETYRLNFSHPLYHGDIEKIVRPKERAENAKELAKYTCMQEEMLKDKIDILIGGFPCQAFSIAGYRKGFDEKRGNLFWSIIDMIKLLEKKHGKPSVLLLENVKNLKGHDKGRTFSIIKENLQQLGYTVKEKVINTKDITNLPQNRERIYIVAFSDSNVAKKFTFFDKVYEMKIKRTEEERIASIQNVLNLHINKKDHEKYYYTKEKYPAYFLTQDEYNKLSDDKKKKERVNIEEQIDEEYQFYQIRRGMYIRKNKNGVCPTLTANMGTGGHNVPLIRVKDGVRKLTPEETFKLQGFPVGSRYKLPTHFKGRPFSDSRLYKQAGNAVTVDIAKILATEILKALHNSVETKKLQKNIIYT